MTDKEKQIEEMARVICSGCPDGEECKRIMCTEWYIAEKIYSAGYRKRVQGVWKTESNGVVVCSNCGEEHEWDDYRPSYCEDCGARMKDDREE